MILTSFPLLAEAQGKEHPVEHPILYRTIQVDGLSIFIGTLGRKTRRCFCCWTACGFHEEDRVSNGIRDFPCEGKNPLRR